MRISDWSSDVCSSGLALVEAGVVADHGDLGHGVGAVADQRGALHGRPDPAVLDQVGFVHREHELARGDVDLAAGEVDGVQPRSEEHTSELQSLMRISYAVFCLKKKKNHNYFSHQPKI